MGVNFSAILEHSLNIIGLMGLPNMLNSDRSFEDLRGLTNNGEWQWLHDADTILHYEIHGFITLTGPSNLKIIFGKYLCELYHVSRWDDFTENQEIQLWLRRVCLSFSPLLNNPIYVPQIYDCDVFVLDGNTMSDVKEFLYNTFGESALLISDIKRIQVNQYNGYSGYYLDKFDDI
ncbi:hypothetical protein FE783_08030 [Paenibacillus mesophilus]|uniref:hypothetical protein n=1 Tax=Paenibacillus mesophilus TaxID=2582849 RepID=UPI00110F5026|nr:hypothetical protein [Paenibacillus mesophilus]TMV50633.1 hypothetical protein FE783_08030 [Paenibacillus mesophilus]